MFSAELTLQPVAPFSFDLSAQIFGDGDPQIRIYKNGKFRQVIRVGRKLVLATVESTGTTDNPRLRSELLSSDEINHEDVERAVKTITLIFNLDLDLLPFYGIAKRDTTLNKVARRLWGLRSPTTQTVYEALIDSIVEQQISLSVATGMERRMIKKFGETLSVGGEICYGYPLPSALEQASIEDLRACGLSGRKAEYVRDISSLVAAGKLDLERFRSYGNAEDIVRELDEVRGIGTWTAELTAIRALQKWDVMPADDVGLRRIIAKFYCDGKRIESDEARKIAEPWGKWRGLAAYYFVVAELLSLDI